MDDDLKKKIGKLIDSKSGPELWREAVYEAVKNNPTIAHEVNLVIKDNRKRRAMLDDQKFGTNTTGSMRYGLRMPFSVEAILAAVDPERFPMTNENGYKKTMKQLRKTFPEFAIAEKH